MAQKERPHWLTLASKADQNDKDGLDTEEQDVTNFLRNSGREAVPKYKGRAKGGKTKRN